MLLLTLRGTPFVYMGDEIGQADGEVPPTGWSTSTAATPSAPRCSGTPAPAAPATGCRSGPRRRASTWPPSATTRPPCSACTASSSGTAELGRPGGDYRSLPDTPGGCYAYLRSAGDERLLVALNFTGQPLDYEVDGPGTGRLSWPPTPPAPSATRSAPTLHLGPDEGVIVRLS